MAREMEIEVIKRETVKPSSPTPEKSRRYELSSLDQYMPTLPVSVLLSYPPTAPLIMSVSETSQLLIDSLSKTLTSFHHFAGRYSADGVAVHCNDEGAGFVATRVSCPLSTVVSNPDLFDSLQNELVPGLAFPREELSGSPLVIVQANFFDCGGLAIAVSVTHKIADASTVGTFVGAWASAALGSEIEPGKIPHFVSSTSVFPPPDRVLPFVERPKPARNASENIKLKILVFHGPKIEALRSKAATETVRNPTRVEAVSALIWKCAIEALPASTHYSGYSFFQAVNIRKRRNPSLPQNTVGNLLSLLQVNFPSSNDADKLELKDLVVVLRNGMDELGAAWKTEVPARTPTCPFEAIRENNGRHKFLASSWCRLPLYWADFGWGKPVGVCIPNMVGGKGTCAMMDREDGEGMEVDLWLPEAEMKRFETNSEILAFASLNPAVTV